MTKEQIEKAEIRLLEKEVKLLARIEKRGEKLLKEVEDFAKDFYNRRERMRKQLERLNGVKPLYKNQKAKEGIKEYFDFIMEHGENIKVTFEENEEIEIFEDTYPIVTFVKSFTSEVKSFSFSPTEKKDILIYELIGKVNTGGTLMPSEEFENIEEWIEHTGEEMTKLETLEKVKAHSSLSKYADLIGLDFYEKEIELYKEVENHGFIEPIQNCIFDSVMERKVIDESRGYPLDRIEKRHGLSVEITPTSFLVTIHTGNLKGNFTTLDLQGEFQPRLFLNPDNHKFLNPIEFHDII